MHDLQVASITRISIHASRCLGQMQHTQVIVPNCCVRNVCFDVVIRNANPLVLLVAQAVRVGVPIALFHAETECFLSSHNNWVEFAHKTKKTRTSRAEVFQPGTGADGPDDDEEVLRDATLPRRIE